MTVYQQITNKPLPQDTLLLPLQYLVFGSRHYGIMFVKLEKDLGRGTSKEVKQGFVEELLGRIPLPQVTSLKGKHIVLYRPRSDNHAFINDIISIVKLGQMQLKQYNAKANIAKIKGHSLYVDEGYLGTEWDYSRLFYGGYLQLNMDSETMVDILQYSLESISSPEMIDHLTGEVLEVNSMIDTPFMICDILPFSIYDGFRGMTAETILQNVYQMVYTIAAYAGEGIYFRDLQPDNFRVSHNQNVKLIDPSYIDASVPPESRYFLFIKQTTPEYLPNAFNVLERQNQQENLKRYFGEFTEGVCIGMLERVLRRIFLPSYMAEKYDNLFLLQEPSDRIESAANLKFCEDLDFFHDVIQATPGPQHFVQYRASVASYLEKEGMAQELIPKLAALLTDLRRFSYPVFSESGCQSLLHNDRGEPVSISDLPQHVENLLKIVPDNHGHTSAIFQQPRSYKRQLAEGPAGDFTLAGRGITASRSPSPDDNVRPCSNTKRLPRSKLSQKTEDTHSCSITKRLIRPQHIAQETKTRGNLPDGRTFTPPATTHLGDKTPTPPPSIKGRGGEVESGQDSRIAAKDYLLSDANKAGYEFKPRLPRQSDSAGANIIASPSPEATFKGRTQFGGNASKFQKGGSWLPPVNTQASEDKHQHMPNSENFQKGGSWLPPTSLPQNKDRYRATIDELLKFVEQKLSEVKKLLEQNATLRDKLSDLFYEKLSKNVSTSMLQDIFAKIENVLRDPDVDFDLLREAQPLISRQIYRELEQHASMENRRYYSASSATFQRGKKIISRHLVRIAKTRYILHADPAAAIVSMLPAANENLAQFICNNDLQYCFTSLREVANVLAKSLAQPRG